MNYLDASVNLAAAKVEKKEALAALQAAHDQVEAALRALQAANASVNKAETKFSLASKRYEHALRSLATCEQGIFKKSEETDAEEEDSEGVEGQTRGRKTVTFHVLQGIQKCQPCTFKTLAEHLKGTLPGDQVASTLGRQKQKGRIAGKRSESGGMLLYTLTVAGASHLTRLEVKFA